MPTLVELVFEYSDAIHNGRTISSIFNAGMDEMYELRDETVKSELQQKEGADGILGEGIDVMLCVIDLIRKKYPEITEDEIVAYARTKCEKWKRKYGVPAQ